MSFERITYNTNNNLVLLDPFFHKDLLLAISNKYRLQFQNNDDGTTIDYKLNDVLIDNTNLAENSLINRFVLTRIADNEVIIRDFRITNIEPNNFSGLENPKYYIYCDNSKK